MKEVFTETRDLQMHEKLLLDTIKRQAGTLQKANLEGVMNSIEAGSPVVRIELVEKDGNYRLSIGDDGAGIETKEDMVAHFETFGTPHDESENTTWKQFRMGRGQMFAFGKNTWRTATFKMVVDIDNKGLTYELTENLPHVKGCQIDIELYKNPIKWSSMEAYREHIQKQVRFMEGVVLFNGEQINTPASKCKWDFQNKDAYFMFNTGTDFKVYNLGAYVMDAPLSETGMMGIVVSKKQVKVNFARNDIQHDCEVYNGEKGILAIVKKNRIKKTRKVSRRLNTWERVATLKDLRDKSQDLDDIQTLSLIPTAQGKHVTLNQIRKMKQQWCFAPMGDRYADKLMERDQALCLSQSIMTDLGYTGIHSQFFTWLTNNQGRTVYGNDEWSNVSILFVEFDSLRDGISDSYSIIPAKKYTASERRIINVLQSQGCWDGRNILLGYSDTARGWTDGSSYIAIERNWLRKQSVTWGVHIAGIQMLMAHEMAHDDDSRGTHIHGPEFDASLRSYLERPYSSISYCADFKGRMLKSRVEDKRQKEQDKIDNAKAKQDKKLNVAAFVS